MLRGESFGVAAVRWPMREVCDNCGRRAIRHSTVTGLMPLFTVEARRAAAEALDWFGDLASGDPDAWLCEGCGNFGILSDPMWGG